MQAVIFIGIQASGKSTFYKEYFFNTHVRISLDLLKTRHRETYFLNTCLKTSMRFVVDNTNPTTEIRARYIKAAQQHGYRVMGYFFQTTLEDAILRNRFRKGKEKIPEIGIKTTHNKLVIPKLEEGFDELFRVTLRDGLFAIE